MKMRRKTLRTLLMAAAASLLICFPAFGAELEGSFKATDNGVYGWAWNKGQFNDVVTVELQFFYENQNSPKETMKVKASQYNKDLESQLGDGWHWFDTSVDWSSMGGKPSKIKAYAILGDTKTGIGSTASEGSSKAEPASSQNASNKKESSSSQADSSLKKGNSLGKFTVTGYCSCQQCSGGHNYTYSGTVPKANHTLSADLAVFPIGTKLWIDGIIYTVEDKGSSVNGEKLDIYYDSHEAAAAHGTITMEVFEVVG